MILVVTHSTDVSADLVIRHLAASNAPFLRLDTDTIGRPQRHFCFSRDGPALAYDDRAIRASEVSAVWARRFSRPTALSEVDIQFVQFVGRELRDVMEAFLDATPGITINRYEADRKAGNRLSQSIAAASVGLKVPETLVTQNPNKAKQFSRSRPVVAKAIGFGSLTEEGDSVAHTTRVTTNEFTGLERCPLLLQVEIPKHHEWRVTTVGDQVFAARTKKESLVDEVDWRRSREIADIFERHELPKAISDSLLALCKLNQLYFGAHDLIETPAGDFYFLETNPAGQWGWLELTLGLPIGEAVARLLCESKGPKC